MKFRKSAAPGHIYRGFQPLLLALALAVLLVLASCGGSDAPAATRLLPDKVKVGLLAPLTGAASTAGRDWLRGATLAVEQINAQGGVYVKDKNGRMQVELVLADDETSAEAGIRVATRLMTQDKVDMVTGGFSSPVTLASQKVIAENKTPFLLTGASTPQVTRRTDIDTSWMFHYLEIGPYRGRDIARSLAEVVRPAIAPGRNLRVAFIYQDSAFGEDFRQGLPGLGIMGYAEAQKLPLEFVYVGKFKLGETDFSRPMAEAKTARPDVVIPMGLEPETIDMVRQGRAAGIDAVWGPVCSCADSATYYKNMGQLGDLTLIENSVILSDPPPGPAGAPATAFVKDYTQRWSQTPGFFAALQYDAMFILKRAIEDAGSLDKTKVRDALKKLDMPRQTVPVEGGRIRFDANNEVRFGSVIAQLRYDPALGESRPKVVWPKELATTQFQKPGRG